jgi:hypothetical protein
MQVLQKDAQDPLNTYLHATCQGLIPCAGHLLLTTLLLLLLLLLLR